LSNFSAQNLLINTHQAHQIAALAFHHLPMGLPADDNSSSFAHHCGIRHHSWLVKKAHQIAAHPFIISQWVYQMIIQAHLGIIVALDAILGWRD
jgi:hypothetical protein